MKRFEYSKTYEFNVSSGRRKHWFFHVIDREAEKMTLRLVGTHDADPIECDIRVANGVETTRFNYEGKEFVLYADRYHSRGIAPDLHGSLLARDAKLKDAYLHMSFNRAEIEASKICGCSHCERIFPPSEIEGGIDNGETAVCPYCDMDTVIGDASYIRPTPELLRDMHTRYF